MSPGEEKGDELWRVLPEQAARPVEVPEVRPIRFSPSRRDFLKLAGASLALGASGCSPPPEEIVPYVDARNAPLPGVPRFYASALVFSGYARGVLIESNDGRPVKVEGNPAHPASLGATDVFSQAEVLQFWDPDRSQAVRRQGRPSTPATMVAALDAQVAQGGGEGLRLLTGYVSSPTLARQIAGLLESLPGARWHQWDPLHRDQGFRGALAAFGRPVTTVHRLEHADLIVSLDADFIGQGPGHLRDARRFIERRREALKSGHMNRLYVAESTPTLAGAMADHRAALSVPRIERLLNSIAQAVSGGRTADDPLAARIAQELAQNRGRSLLIAGPALSAAAHALVHWLNASLDAPGRTLNWLPASAGTEADCTASTNELVADMRAGRVKTLVVIGGNPVYDAPADLGFGAALARVPFSLHLSLDDNETSALTTWHVPQAHAFEHWSDALADDGTATVVQPVISPLYGGLSAHEILGILFRQPTTAYEAVRAHWKSAAKDDFEAFWTNGLRSGTLPLAAAQPLNVRPTKPPALAASAEENRWTLRFHQDDAVRAGEYANNAWLQELPRPITKITWDNAVMLSPNSAKELGLQSGQTVEITTRTGKITAPAWITPGQADGVLSIALGYGRPRVGRFGKGVGFNAYALRAADSPWSMYAVQVRVTGGPSHAFATTQNHDVMEGRDLLRHGTFAEFAADPKRFKHAEDTPEHSLYKPWPYEGYRWGMAIDLTACIGCNACTIACQAENNIPVVGKEEVIAGREMHWIRIDRYFKGPPQGAQAMFMPVPCMHCEHAPCEYVCPVEASIHDSEGLNLQVYNRCVGTRFCSQNCPYKVRRFNFLQYSNEAVESLKGAQNPEVTVRQRGVMEKCTYCVQRITRGRIEAEKEGRRITDGEVVTACQAVCPTRAIVFGDLNDPSSAVNAAKASPLDYPLLGELNTVPRTTYLARLSNPADRFGS